MKRKPIYYRWCYSPSTGDVTLSHNYEGHVADIRFHSDMAKERQEGDLQFGYAYRLDNGWKVTDDKHKPETDVHLRVAVEKAIEGQEHPKLASLSAPEWTPDRDAAPSKRIRYGKPIERLYENRSQDQETVPYHPDTGVSDDGSSGV